MEDCFGPRPGLLFSLAFNEELFFENKGDYFNKPDFNGLLGNSEFLFETSLFLPLSNSYIWELTLFTYLPKDGDLFKFYVSTTSGNFRCGLV